MNGAAEDGPPAPLRFRPPRWQRWSWLLLACGQLLTALQDSSPWFIGLDIGLVVLAVALYFGVQTRVDVGGITIPGGWWTRRIPWTAVSGFTTDPKTHRPALVLADDQIKRLVYVPDEAYGELYRRWEGAIDHPSPRST